MVSPTVAPRPVPGSVREMYMHRGIRVYVAEGPIPFTYEYGNMIRGERFARGVTRPGYDYVRAFHCVEMWVEQTQDYMKMRRKELLRGK